MQTQLLHTQRSHIKLPCVRAHVGQYRLVLGIIVLPWGVTLGPQAFLECLYQQRESLALGVLLNVNSQREWFSVAVEYRL